MAATGNFPYKLQNAVKQIANSDGTTVLDVYTAPAASGALLGGARVNAITITNTETAAHDVQIFLNVSSVAYLLGTITVPASAGNLATVAAKKVLLDDYWGHWAYDANGNKTFIMLAGAKLQIGLLVLMASAKTMQVVCEVEEF